MLNGSQSSITDFLGQVGSCDNSPTWQNPIHLCDAIGKSANHINSMMQMTGFILVEFGHRRKWVGNTSVLDYGAERLNGRSVRLKIAHFGIADWADRTSQQERSSSDSLELIPATRPGTCSPRNLAVSLVYPATLEQRVNPGNFPSKLLLQEISHNCQTGRTGSHNNSSTFLGLSHPQIAHVDRVEQRKAKSREYHKFTGLKKGWL